MIAFPASVNSPTSQQVIITLASLFNHDTTISQQNSSSKGEDMESLKPHLRNFNYLLFQHFHRGKLTKPLL